MTKQENKRQSPVKNYQLQEGLLPVPPQWKDETVNVFAANEGDGDNLVVTRVDIPEGIADEDFYKQTLQQFADQLPGFKRVKQGEIAIADTTAPYLHYEWKSPEGAMYQIAVLYVHPVIHRMMVFTFSATAAISEQRRNNFLSYITGFKANS